MFYNHLEKPVLAMEREARRKLKLCFINVLELANTHQQRYSRTAEIASTLYKKKALILMHCLSPSSVLMWALMWVLMWIVMCVLMWILMWLGPHVSPYVNPQNPSASSHTPHTTTSALSGLVASLGLCVCSVCALCVFFSYLVCLAKKQN